MIFGKCDNCTKYRHIYNKKDRLCKTCDDKIFNGIMNIYIDQLKIDNANKAKRIFEIINNKDKYALASKYTDCDVYMSVKKDEVRVLSDDGIDVLRNRNYKDFDVAIRNSLYSAYRKIEIKN